MSSNTYKKNDDSVTDSDDTTNKEKSVTVSDETESETQPSFLSVAMGSRGDVKIQSQYNAAAHKPLLHDGGSLFKIPSKDRLEVPPVIRKGWTECASLVNCEYFRSRTVFEVQNIKESNFEQNVMECMKLRSLHVVFDGAIASCKTIKYTKFTIRLLRKSMDEDTILVDIRRTDGCAIEFRDEYQAMYRAAIHGETTPIPGPKKFTIPFDDLIPLEEGCIERSLDRCIKNLECNQHDLYVLTLQDLASITNPSSSGTCKTASKLIIREDQKYFKIFQNIVKDIKKKVGPSEYDSDDTEEYLRGLALSIFGNILTSVVNEASFLSLIERQHNNEMIEALVWYVKDARKCPWNACLAAKCLGLLRRVFSQSLYIDVEQHLENAEAIGKLSHNLLAKESRTALDADHF